MASPETLQPPTTAELITKLTPHVSTYMSHFDASHDYQHILRVVALAKTILAHEQASTPHLRPDIVHLAALLHDIGDRKYLQPDEDGPTMVQTLLTAHAAPPHLAAEIQHIVTHVSYSSEIANPAAFQRALARYPELAIVQDADRLDAMGAVGIARTFAYNAKGAGGLEDARRHFEEKLERLEGMMKTRTGRQMARVRTERLKVFRGWWDEEVGVLE